MIIEDAVRSVRPGYGLPPKALGRIIGRKMATGVSANVPVTEGVLN